MITSSMAVFHAAQLSSESLPGRVLAQIIAMCSSTSNALLVSAGQPSARKPMPSRSESLSHANPLQEDLPHEAHIPLRKNKNDEGSMKGNCHFDCVRSRNGKRLLFEKRVQRQVCNLKVGF